MLAFAGMDVKPLRMASSSPTNFAGNNAGARHTIDNILGLAGDGRGKEPQHRHGVVDRERSDTPGNGESAGERKNAVVSFRHLEKLSQHYLTRLG